MKCFIDALTDNRLILFCSGMSLGVVFGMIELGDWIGAISWLAIFIALFLCWAVGNAFSMESKQDHKTNKDDKK